MSTCLITFCKCAISSYALILLCKRWQLTCVQHTRRLTDVQHMKYYSLASYNCTVHEDGLSHVVHEIELACSKRKLMFRPLLPPVTKPNVYTYIYTHSPILLRQLMEVGVGKVVRGPKGYAVACHRCSQYFFCL